MTGARTRLVFLGTGASGGTPGRGRSYRRESSMLLSGATTLLVDASRHVDEQLSRVPRVDALLLTHGHRDATGGIPRLRRWARERGLRPIPVFAHPKTLAALERRYARLDHCDPVAVVSRRRYRRGSFRFCAIEVPHSRDPAVPTLAWRVECPGSVVVYASDVARPTKALERFCDGADLLVLDGATYGRSIYTHLRIDRDLPTVCGWGVGRILLTQIGRSAPPHEQLAPIVRGLCARARPAHDGLVVEV